MSALSGGRRAQAPRRSVERRSRSTFSRSIAEGGAGKSALVNEWLTRLRADSYRGATIVLGWSFYSQG